MYPKDVYQVLLALATFGRRVHINTGTTSFKDGSTIFWESAGAAQWLQDKKNKEAWIKGSHYLMKKVQKTISKIHALIGDKQRISATFVASDVFPTYPKNCDVVNAWSFSYASPRCQKFEQQWKFGLWLSADLADQVEFFNSGSVVKKLGTNSWVRVFGTRYMRNAVYQWSLTLEKYPSDDLSEFTCGVCSAQLVNKQGFKTTTTFDYYQIIKSKGFYGLDGSGAAFKMVKKVDKYELQSGDKLDLKLNLRTGLFQVSRNGVVLAEATGLDGNFYPSCAIKHKGTVIKLSDISINCPGEHGLIKDKSKENSRRRCDCCYEIFKDWEQAQYESKKLPVHLLCLACSGISKEDSDINAIESKNKGQDMELDVENEDLNESRNKSFELKGVLRDFYKVQQAIDQLDGYKQYQEGYEGHSDQENHIQCIIDCRISNESCFDANLTKLSAINRIRNVFWQAEQEFQPYNDNQEIQQPCKVLFFYFTGHATRTGLEFEDGVLTYERFLNELRRGILRRQYCKDASYFIFVDGCYSGKLIEKLGTRDQQIKMKKVAQQIKLDKVSKKLQIEEAEAKREAEKMGQELVFDHEKRWQAIFNQIQAQFSLRIDVSSQAEEESFDDGISKGGYFTSKVFTTSKKDRKEPNYQRDQEIIKEYEENLKQSDQIQIIQEQEEEEEAEKEAIEINNSDYQTLLENLYI